MDSEMEHEKMMRTRAQEARQKEWSLQQWKPSAALVDKSSESGIITKYAGQKYDPKNQELVKNGWSHDHCLFCWQSICNCGGENCQPQGYTDGEDWICKSCHKKIIVEGKDPTTN
jgi:hypothetical protein